MELLYVRPKGPLHVTYVSNTSEIVVRKCFGVILDKEEICKSNINGEVYGPK